MYFCQNSLDMKIIHLQSRAEEKTFLFLSQFSRGSKVIFDRISVKNQIRILKIFIGSSFEIQYYLSSSSSRGEYIGYWEMHFLDPTSDIKLIKGNPPAKYQFKIINRFSSQSKKAVQQTPESMEARSVKILTNY